MLEGDDVVVAADPRAAYLLEHRYGLRTLARGSGPEPLPELPPDVAGALARGERRLVLVPVAGDPWPPSGELHPTLDVHVLVGGELRRVAAGEPYGG